MTMTKKIDLKNVLAYRKSQGINQSAFWSRIGVTQSGGSRYENGRTIPKPAAMLLWLRETGRLTDKDLADAKKATSKK
ncbi:MAG: helix-turn-helix domain-containing protein [Rhodocyclaceae bacterium]